MTKFKVGDKVRITEDLYPRLIGKVGQIIEDDGSTIPYLVVLENGEEHWKHAKNIELLKDSPSTHNENLVLTRLFHAEAEVDKMSRSIDELKRRIETLEAGKADKPKFNTFSSGMINKATARFAESVRRSLQTPNQRRAIVIKRAEAFVADLRKRAVSNGPNSDGNSLFNGKRTRLEFHVNADKGVVTALVKSNLDGRLLGKAFAKCAPGDVFNADIGKAIAAGRLYGKDVTEFEQSVQPTEVVVGMRVDNSFHHATKFGWGVGKVTAIDTEGRSGRGYTANGDSWSFLDSVIILDDSDAIYE